MQPPLKKSSARNKWGWRSIAILGSCGSLVGFWQLAAHNPHPAQNLTNGITPTPTDQYSVPVTTTLLPLPTPPHSSTGNSK